MNVVGVKALNNSTNIQLGYDLISQETNNNRSLIRAYLVLNVLGSHVTWTRGSAAVQGLSVNIGTYYSRGSYTLVTNEFWVGHDVNGNFSGTLAGSLWTTWLKGDVSGSFTLPQIQRYAVITRYDKEVTDEQNPSMDVFNPAGYVLNLRLEFAGYAIRRNGLIVNGRYNFILTEEEKNIIYDHNKEENEFTVRYCVATTYDGVSEAHYSFFDTLYHIVQKLPEFELDYVLNEDINPKTLEITGNKKIFIENYSKVQSSILKPMEVYKKAYPKEYWLRLNNNFLKAIPFKNEIIKETFDLLKRKEYGYANLTIDAIDSRRGFTSATELLTLIKYSKPNIYLTAERLNNFENETTIKINGNFSFFELKGKNLYQLDTSKIKTNTIKHIKFRYKEVGGEFGNWSEIPFIIEENKFTCVEKKLNLDNEKSFEIEVKIEDLLDEVTINGVVDIGVPSFFISTNKNAVGVNCIPNEDAKVGEIYYKNEAGENKRVLDYQKQAEIVQFKDRDELVYPKTKREILMAKKTSWQNLNITFQTILFEEVEINNTDKLSYENGIITIKKGVKRIGLTSHLFAQNAFNAYLFGFVRKNEENVQEYICEGSQNFKELNISNVPINVQENDKIYIFAQINKNDYGQIRSGYLSVEVLE